MIEAKSTSRKSVRASFSQRIAFGKSPDRSAPSKFQRRGNACLPLRSLALSCSPFFPYSSSAVVARSLPQLSFPLTQLPFPPPRRQHLHRRPLLRQLHRQPLHQRQRLHLSRPLHQRPLQRQHPHLHRLPLQRPHPHLLRLPLQRPHLHRLQIQHLLLIPPQHPSPHLHPLQLPRRGSPS
jgi:hypothetical protein